MTRFRISVFTSWLSPSSLIRVQLLHKIIGSTKQILLHSPSNHPWKALLGQGNSLHNRVSSRHSLVKQIRFCIPLPHDFEQSVHSKFIQWMKINVEFLVLPFEQIRSGHGSSSRSEPIHNRPWFLGDGFVHVRVRKRKLFPHIRGQILQEFHGDHPPWTTHIHNSIQQSNEFLPSQREISNGFPSQNFPSNWGGGCVQVRVRHWHFSPVSCSQINHDDHDDQLPSTRSPKKTIPWHFQVLIPPTRDIHNRTGYNRTKISRWWMNWENTTLILMIPSTVWIHWSRTEMNIHKPMTMCNGYFQYWMISSQDNLFLRKKSNWFNEENEILLSYCFDD